MNSDERNEWITKEKAAAKHILDDYRQMLMQAMFRDEEVTAYEVMKECTSIAECILDEQKNSGAGPLLSGAGAYRRKRSLYSAAP